MSLGAKITILCYTFGVNRVHQVPLVYHHFPHWNWSLKVRLIFLDKLMFFKRALFEAFLCVCVCGSCVHQTSNLRNTQLASVQVLSPVATSLQPGCGSMGRFFSDMFPIYWIVISNDNHINDNHRIIFRY